MRVSSLNSSSTVLDNRAAYARLRVASVTAFLMVACANAVASPPDIDIWYGQNQPFGILGSPQKWVNILGNVNDPDGIASLTYTLNNGNSRPLSIGPDLRRLVEEGDFNVEIDRAELVQGSNEVVVTATDLLGNPASVAVTVSYDATSIWPSNYWTDWLGTQSISEAAQVVDGKWTLENSGIRTGQVGYDRAFAIGDQFTWSDYEVTVAITIHGIDLEGFNPISVAPGIGFTNRWRGHTTLVQGEQPNAYWLPAGVTPWFDFYAERLQLSLQNNVVYDQSGLQLNLDETYLWKLRSEKLPNGDTFHGFKVWSESDEEPSQWLLSGIKNPPAVNDTGSLILIPHHVDATIGAINVLDLVNDTDPPVINGIQIQPQPNGVTINWSTNEPATTSVAYGPDETYSLGTITEPGYGINHSVFLPNLLPGQNYHFSISAVDARQNTTVSPDQAFTYTPGTASNIVSDDFSAPSLATDIWTFVDPAGDTTLNMTGTQVQLHLPVGSDRDFWSASPVNRMPRILQSIADEDFEVEAKFESPMSVNYQIQGITVEESSRKILRFEFLYIGSQLRFFAAAVDSLLGTATVYANFTVGNTTPKYMRVKRTGNQWSAVISNDGVSWTAATQFTRAMTANSVGVYAANSANTAHTATIDYFFNTASPIIPEDGPGGGDLEAPSAVQDLSGFALSDTEIYLNWSPATDNVGVTAYEVRRGGALIATVASAPYTNTGLSPQTGYDYTVVALDAAGNRSPAANISLTTLEEADTEAPTSPGSLSGLATSNTTVQLQWTASTDNTGVTGYEISRDGVVVATTTTTEYLDSGLSAGISYGYVVVATDAAGNRSIAATINVTTQSIVDAEPPDMPGDLTAVALGASAVQLGWTASTDNVGVTGYQVLRDGTLITTTSVPGYTDQGLTANTSYGYSVIAVDAAGNPSAAANTSVTTSAGSSALSCDNAVSTHLWEPQPTRAPLLLVFSHPDDEVIQFRGTLPYYRNVRNIPIVGIATTNFSGGSNNLIREAELHNAFWTYGMRNPPLFGNQPDNCFGSGVPCVLAQWNYDALVKYLTEQIRRYQPEVVLTHDLNGEIAAHPNHIVTALATIDAYNYASDPLRYPEQLSIPGVNVWQPRKLYIHQYPQNAWFHDWNTAYPELGGATPEALAEAGFLCHVSQYTPPRTQTFEPNQGYQFGLYQSDTGIDTVGGDFFENVVIAPVIEREFSGGSASSLVSMSTLTPGSIIHYTTDGSNPDETSTAYTGPVLIDPSVEVKARAFLSSTQFSAVRIEKAQQVSSSSPIISSDFRESSLNTDVWTFVDSIGDVALNMTGTQAQIVIPAGHNRDYWTGSSTNRMPRLIQSVSVQDFEVEAKFESPLNTNYQIQGITVEASSLNIMRMEFMYIDSRLVFFAAAIIDGRATVHAYQSVSVNAPMYMRVKRAGDQWTVSVSSDGASWIVAKIFNQSIAVNAIGVYAANSSNTAHTASIDYFFNTAAPIVPEDGDTEAPTAPSNLVGVALSDTTVELTWAAATDNVAVTGYAIHRGGQLLTTVTTPGFTDSGLTAATAYDYAVYALDEAGNQSVAATVSVSTDSAPDTEAPTPPSNLLGVALSDSTVELTWAAATDNVAVTGYAVHRGGQLLSTVTTPGFTDSGLTAATAYDYAVYALDEAGNQSAAATVSVTTDSAPDTEAPTPPSNLLGVALSDTTVELTWAAATDNVAVTGYAIHRGGQLLTTVTTAGFTDSALTAATTYDYAVYALDEAGNQSAAATVSVTTDSAPDTEAPTPPSNLLGVAVTYDSVQLTWTPSTDNVEVTGYEIKRDGLLIATVSSPTYTDQGLLTNKQYNYSVVAIDAAANRSTATAVSVTTPLPPGC